MTTFAASKGRAAVRVLVLPEHSFASEWALRPRGGLSVGLRMLSEADLENVQIAAAQHCVEALHQGDKALVDDETREDVFNSRIMVGCVARSLCDPQDATKPHPLFPFADDQIAAGHITADAVRFLWDAIGRMRLEVSPIAPVASDADLELLEAYLRAGGVAALPPTLQIPARKLLAAVLAQLKTHAPAVSVDEGDDDEDEDDDVAVYRVRSLHP